MMPKVGAFKGEFPRVAARKLPDDCAQQALNCRLLSGDLECWKNFEEEVALSKGAGANTIYPLEDSIGTVAWLHWLDAELGTGAVEVDVAKSASSTDGRIFLTGLDIPRWTNYSLATQSGSSQYPVVTRPLGVVNPGSAPTLSLALSGSPAVTVTDDFTVATNWTFSPQFNNGTIIREARLESSGGNPGARLLLNAQEIQDGPPAIGYRDLGLESSGQVELEFDIFINDANTGPVYQFSAAFMCSSNGSGPRLGFSQTLTGSNAFLAVGSSWNGNASIISLVNVAAVPAEAAGWYRVRITGSRRANGNYDFTMTAQLGSAAPLFTQAFDNVSVGGGWCGIAIPFTGPASSGPMTISIDNLYAAGSLPFDDESDNISTSYVYTFVNDIGEESGPSDPSETVSIDDGTVVTITTPTGPPSGVDYFIDFKRIYRAVSSASGTAFFFVAEIPLATATYADDKSNSELGEELTTTGYELPPSDMRGILALPNDIYAGFRQSSNELCLSAQGAPHAWPVAFRLKTDEPIVAIGNIDTVVAIATEAFSYTAAGTAPDNYAMTKSEVKQGCVSKRGCTYLKGLGWVFPSGDGLVAVAGVGQAQLMTSGLFTRREWQALVPATLISEVHDDRYFGFYTDCNDNKRGILLDVNAGAFGKITLGFHATAAFSWAKTDTLYLVLDENFVPATGSPQTDGQVVPNGQTIYKFDTYCTGGTLTKYLPRQWLSKKWQMGGDLPLMCRIRATDFADVRLIVYNQGWPYYTVDVVSNKPFRLPKLYTIEEFFQFAIQGTSFVQSVEFGYEAEDFEP